MIFQRKGGNWVALPTTLTTEQVQPTFVGIQVEQERRNVDNPQVAVGAATLSVNHAAKITGPISYPIHIVKSSKPNVTFPSNVVWPSQPETTIQRQVLVQRHKGGVFTANFQRTPTVRTFLRTRIVVVSQREQTQIDSQQASTPLPVGRGGVMARAMARIKARKLARASEASTSPTSRTRTLPVWPVSPIPKIQLPSEPVLMYPPSVALLPEIQIPSNPIPISPPTPLPKIKLPSELVYIRPPPAEPISKIQLPSDPVPNSSPLPTIPTPPAPSLPKKMIYRDSTEPSFKNVEDRIVENPVPFLEAEKYFEGNKTLEDKIETTNLHEDVIVNPNKAPITKNSDGKYGCRLCGKTFAESGSAKRHESFHSGEKPFACRNCQYKTRQLSNLKKHEENHKITDTVPSVPVPTSPTTTSILPASKSPIQLSSEPEQSKSKSDVHKMKFGTSIVGEFCNNPPSELDYCLALYGEKMPMLVSEIKKNRSRFLKLPIGPLGMEVKIKKNVPIKYVEVIETEIAKFLAAFLVYNDQDMKVLRELADCLGFKIPIYPIR